MSENRLSEHLEHIIAHGYFEINLDVVWDTVQSALPNLLQSLPIDRDDDSGQASR